MFSLILCGHFGCVHTIPPFSDTPTDLIGHISIHIPFLKKEHKQNSPEGECWYTWCRIIVTRPQPCSTALVGEHPTQLTEHGRPVVSMVSFRCSLAAKAWSTEGLATAEDGERPLGDLLWFVGCFLHLVHFRSDSLHKLKLLFLQCHRWESTVMRVPCGCKKICIRVPTS